MSVNYIRMNRLYSIRYHDFDRLERESRKYFFIGYFFGFLFLMPATYFIGYDGIKDVDNNFDKAIPIKLIVIPPSVRNPFVDIHKEIKPKAYTRIHSNETVIPPAKLKRPGKYEIQSKSYYAIKSDETNNILNENMSAEKALIDLTNPFDMSPDDTIPLKNQLFFDSGLYKTEIVFNPKNKKAIQGYVHFGIGWGKYLTPPDILRKSVNHLAEALNKYTNIEAIPDPVVYIAPIVPDDKLEIVYAIQNAEERANFLLDITQGDYYQLHKYAFLYLNIDKTFILSKAEQGNLDRFIREGGFIIFDNGAAEYDKGIVDRYIRENIINVLHHPLDGRNCLLKPISTRHPIFHSFFDFNEIPSPSLEKTSISENDKIIGIFIGGGNQGALKLVGIYTPQGYSMSWQNPQNTEQIKLGVNMVVYALTRYKEIAANNEEGYELISEKRIMRK